MRTLNADDADQADLTDLNLENVFHIRTNSLNPAKSAFNNRLLVASEIVIDELGHHVYLTLRQLSTKRDHSVAAVRYLVRDGVLGYKFEFAFAKARDLCTVVERAAVALRSVTDRTMLPKERRLVRFAVRNYKRLFLSRKTRSQCKDREKKNNEQLQILH
jgi:hypothetical protein